MTQTTTLTTSNYGDSTLAITTLITDMALVGNYAITVTCSDALQSLTTSF